MSRRKLVATATMRAWWLNECLRLVWDKAQPCAGETCLKYKPRKGEKHVQAWTDYGCMIGKLAEVQERERAAATTQHRT